MDAQQDSKSVLSFLEAYQSCPCRLERAGKETYSAIVIPGTRSHKLGRDAGLPVLAVPRKEVIFPWYITSIIHTSITHEASQTSLPDLQHEACLGHTCCVVLVSGILQMRAATAKSCCVLAVHEYCPTTVHAMKFDAQW